MANAESIRVELQDENVHAKKVATVRVYDGDKLVATVTATITNELGADLELYPTVKLNRQ